MSPSILVTGSSGQIGSELLPFLRDKYGPENVVAGTHRTQETGVRITGPSEHVDVGNKDELARVVREHHVDTIYHLAAVLSTVGEKDPQLAWDVNMQGLKNVLDVSKEMRVSRLFWPSSIAVFGKDAPRDMAPQVAPLVPGTIYGVAKVAGELLCNYYHIKYGIDVRSLRYPGLISNVAKPGGGTTDYAVEIFYEAIQNGSYRCFLREDTTLPMMYMPDAIRAVVGLMESEPAYVKRRTSYNLAAMSFSAGELATEIAGHISGFVCEYAPDSRQAIADGWPRSIDDTEARRDWGWIPRYDLSTMTEDMIKVLTPRLRGSPTKG